MLVFSGAHVVQRELDAFLRQAPNGCQCILPRLHQPYPFHVNDDEWSLVVPYPTLMTEEAPHRNHSLRELSNALRYVIRYGIAWRAMPSDFAPRAAGLLAVALLGCHRVS